MKLAIVLIVSHLLAFGSGYAVRGKIYRELGMLRRIYEHLEYALGSDEKKLREELDKLLRIIKAILGGK